MAVDVVFSDAKKGYNKDEVQRFIMQLTSDHAYAIGEKNDAIKTLMNEKDAMERSYSARIAELEAALEAAQAENKDKTAKYDELCARMGEKLLFAESRSAQIIAEAEESKQRIEAEARKKAEESVAAVAAKAREDAASALRAADVLRQKSQNINAGLDHTKRVLEEAIAAIERLVKND
ncbi:MAG: hypothetical protein IKK83_06865 [Clostridia bacterium]|nr:hypothetical protein [Clostridia bacterium]